MYKRLYIIAYMNIKIAEGLGSQLRRLLELLDGELEKIYARDELAYRPRYTPVMKALSKKDGLTIKDIASKSSISHSAASQTVSIMVGLDFVAYEHGADGRERLVYLSEKGLNYLPVLQCRWQATQAAADELDMELSSPLSDLLAEAIERLQSESFSNRITKQENNRITRSEVE
jgi:DNA-binding MarR family transcriptional regulator